MDGNNTVVECDKPNLFAANNSIKTETLPDDLRSTDRNYSAPMPDKPHLFALDRSLYKIDGNDAESVSDKSNIFANNDSIKTEHLADDLRSTDRNDSAVMPDTPHLFAADSSIKADALPGIIDRNDTAAIGDKPHLFAADSSVRGGALIDNSQIMDRNDTAMYNMYDKPYLFPADSSNRSLVIPDHMQAMYKNTITYNTFNKPHLFAADSSKKPLTLSDMMPENIRKRRSITVKEKLDILNMFDSGQKLSAVARQFGISSSTASTIVKERFKIKMLSDHYNIDPERKRMRLGIYRDVDEAVHLWFRQMRMKNIPINGPMLQQKAREFAIQLGHKNFEGSSGWLFRFRERHRLSVKTMRDNDDNNLFNCSGVGMTDDEIVTSVCQNTVHSLTFIDNKDKVKPVKQKSNKSNILNHNLCIPHEIPENYLIPEIELTDYEPNVGIPEALSLAEKLTSFLKKHDPPPDVLKSMNTVTNFLDHDLREQIKQRKITDFFTQVSNG